MKIQFLRLIIFTGLILTLFSCQDKLNNSKKNLVWEKFKTRIENKDLDYLNVNSTDSIKCVDCISNDKGILQTSELIFKEYIDKLYNSDLLDKKQYSIYENDSIIRISYNFKKVIGNESSNITYMFDKINDKFLFTGMITTP